MNRWRTRPQTVMTAKSQHSSSHHLPMIRSHGDSPVADRDPVGFFLGREVPARVVEPARQLLRDRGGPSAAWARATPRSRNASFSEISPLTSGVRADHGQRGQEQNRESGASARPSAPGIADEPDEPGQPDRERHEDHLGPRQVAEPGGEPRAQREPPIAAAEGRSAPSHKARNVHMSPRLSLSVSWPSSAARGNRTASAAARQAIRRSKSDRVRA